MPKLYNDLKKLYDRELLKMELEYQFLDRGWEIFFCTVSESKYFIHLWAIWPLLQLLQFCHCNKKEATDNTEMNGHDCAPIKL